MPDREKVIGSLQEAAAYFRSSFDAMYGTVVCEKFREWTDAIEQALTLLKAQKPREISDAELMDAIRKAPIIVKPAVDAAPVVHARWIDECCSVCGTYVYHGDADNYCPHCGAKMDKED